MEDIYGVWRTRVGAGEAIDLRELHRDLYSLEKKVLAEERGLQKQRERVEKARADLNALRGLRNFFVHNAGVVDAKDEAARVPGTRRGKRDAILSLLAGGRALHTTVIRKLLADAGEIREDEVAYHTLQVTLSQMYRAGELERPARGIYQLPRTQQDQAIKRPSDARIAPGRVRRSAQRDQ